jgi:hypothetical protein
MADFRTIEIDFDIHKLIEGERKNFSETPNAVLRRLLKLPVRQAMLPSKKSGAAGRSWSGEGVTLPHGTAIRMKYNRRLYEGEIVDGRWAIDGKNYDTPSGAASAVGLTKRGKKTRLDGWIYWQARVPGDTTWTPISALRQEPSSATAMTAEQLDL